MKALGARRLAAILVLGSLFPLPARAAAPRDPTPFEIEGTIESTTPSNPAPAPLSHPTVTLSVRGDRTPVGGQKITVRIPPGAKVLVDGKPDAVALGGYPSLQPGRHAAIRGRRIPVEQNNAFTTEWEAAEIHVRSGTDPGTPAPPPAALTTRIVLELQDRPLAELLALLKKEAGLQYIASAEALAGAKPVSRRGEDTVAQILNDACQQAGVRWSLTDDGVVAIKAGPEAARDGANAGAFELRIGRLFPDGGLPAGQPGPNGARQVLPPGGRPGWKEIGPAGSIRLKLPAGWAAKDDHGGQGRLSLGKEGIATARLSIALLDYVEADQAQHEFDVNRQAPGRRSIEIGGCPAAQWRYEQDWPMPGAPAGVGRAYAPPPGRMCTSETRILWGDGLIVEVSATFSSVEGAGLYDEIETIARGVAFGDRPGPLPPALAQVCEKCGQGVAEDDVEHSDRTKPALDIMRHRGCGGRVWRLAAIRPPRNPDDPIPPPARKPGKKKARPKTQ